MAVVIALMRWHDTRLLDALAKERYLSISGGAEYPVRWTGPPAPQDVYVSGQVGFGMFTWGRPDRNRSPAPSNDEASSPSVD